MAVLTKTLVDELYEVEGKAEIVNGEIVRLMATGLRPNKAAGRIYRSLGSYEDEHGGGVALTDNAGFLVNLYHRESFSPDVAWYTGPDTGMKFLEGAPVFAVEVRSENDYGRKAEREIAEKRDDYFDTGALVVWDVDLLNDVVIKSYTADDPDNPRVFLRGDIADAEPAVPGWQMPVDDLFS
ncbi:MAG: Uma2 family endonuclease [Acidobacteriota bacterium]